MRAQTFTRMPKHKDQSVLSGAKIKRNAHAFKTLEHRLFDKVAGYTQIGTAENTAVSDKPASPVEINRQLFIFRKENVMPKEQISVHTHEDDLEMYVRGRLELGHASEVESHLIDCPDCQERFSRCIGLQLNVHPTGAVNAKGKSERSEPRFAAGDQAILQEMSPLSVARQNVEIVDVSRNGLGILASKSTLPGTIVQVRIKGTVELGEVRYCNPTSANKYRVGLRLHTQF